MGNESGSTMEEVQHYPTSLYVMVYLLGILVGVAALVGNILLLVVFRASHENPQKAFKSKTTVILTSISIGDMLAVIILLINVGLVDSFDEMGVKSEMGCYFWNVVKAVPLLAGFLLQIELGVERYVMINLSPQHPRMNRLLLFTCCVWVYAVVCCLVGFGFAGTVRDDAYALCDVTSLSPLFVTVILFVHVMVATVVTLALILLVRNTIKLHQQKIQVSNTITYNNLINDASTAQLFYIVYLVSLVLWLPFFICEIVLVAGVVSVSSLTAARWSYLIGHLGLLRCYWYLFGSETLRNDFKRTFGRQEEARPTRLGTAGTRDG